VGSIAQFHAVLADCEQAHDEIVKSTSLLGLGISLSRHGQYEAARAAAAAALAGAEGMGEYFEGMGYASLAQANLGAGDIDAAYDASGAAWRCMSVGQPRLAIAQRCFNATEIAMARGDLATARTIADAAVEAASGWHRVGALVARARIAIAQGATEEGERDAYDALAAAVANTAYLSAPEVLDCLAGLATRACNHAEAARQFGAAEAFRTHMGMVRYTIYEAGYRSAVAELRNAMEEKDFHAAWAEGAALSIEEAIAYAQRGRGERKRPASGWASLTPAERDVARLICEGLANKEIATRLFVSPRTVQAHLSHIYTKLGIASRVQLVQQAARNS
jgi:DNA-binding CsgD family transcriptional regulator